MILVLAMMLTLGVCASAESTQRPSDRPGAETNETTKTGGSDDWSDPGFYPIRHNFDDWRDY